MDKTNTHCYDGKLNGDFLPELSQVKNLSLPDKIARGQGLIGKHSWNPVSRRFLTILVGDMGTNNNFDPTNSLSADDLLCLCASKADNPDFLLTLEAQLIDMQTGHCPQGRVHRLFQTLLAFPASIDTVNN